jgi:signal transduction histidine kinase
MIFRRKLLLGFSLMALPTLLIGAEAIRANVLERRALQALGEDMARTRTYAELETAMFDQGEAIWRYLSGMDPTARKEFQLTGEVVGYWQQRWRATLRPNEIELANSAEAIQRQIQTVAERIFTLYDSGEREVAYRLAQQELRGRLFPALTQLNRYIYRRARESSVQGTYSRLEAIVADEGRALLSIFILALVTSLVASWLIANGLSRPIGELRRAMGVVGEGQLDHPIAVDSPDEIGDLARAFAGMTENLRQSRAEMVRLNAELEGKVAQLERTQTQLVQSEKLASIGEMAAAVAHGMRNPLASLRAAAQLALHHAEPVAAREPLRAIIQEVDRLDRRIGHLLSFSRPAPFHPRRENVAHVVEDLLPGFSELLHARGVELEVEIAPALPEVRVDPMQLEQALVEIISNALDAMTEGGLLRIKVFHESEANGAAWIVIEIADTGPGIPAHVLPSVGEPFFTTRPEGTGLGLATAKRYVAQNGGHLAIRRGDRVGTVVSVRLPTAESNEVSAAAQAPVHPADHSA